MSSTSSDNAAADAKSDHGFLSSLRHHLLHNWAGILLVASVVSLVKNNFTWISAFDGYTFLTVSNVVSIVLPTICTPRKEAAVVLVDPPTFEQRYRGRTPLDRCELTRDLQTIYQARPDTVAVDLDLSPALWLQPRGDMPAATKPLPSDCPTSIASDEAMCEQQLYSLIRCAAASGTRTILVEPAPAATGLPQHQHIKDNWKDDLKNGYPEHIFFAQTHLHEVLGMLLTYQADRDSMPMVARRLACDGRADADECRMKIDKTYGNSAYIDVRSALPKLKFIPLEQHANPDEFRKFLERSLWGIRADDNARNGIVFFGGAFGQNDIFTSSMGHIYGVELLAGIYASGMISVHHILDFLADLIGGTLLGTFIAYRWRRFYLRRSHPDPLIRQRAWPGLIFPVVLVTYAAIAIAVALLKLFSIWFSPLPMLIGILIDAYAIGPVEQALQKYRESADKPSHTNWEILRRPVFFGGLRLLRDGQIAAGVCVLVFNAIAAGVILIAIYGLFH